MPEAPRVCPIWDLKEVRTVRLEELKKDFQGTDLLHVALRVLVAWHSTRSTASAHRVPLERGADGDLLGDTGGLHHAQMVVARSHARDDGVDQRPSCTGRTFPLDDNYPPPSPRTIPSRSASKGREVS